MNFRSAYPMTTIFAMSFALSMLSVGCPDDGECSFNNDCGAGKFCQDGACQDLDIPDAPDGGTVIPNGDAGPGQDGGMPDGGMQDGGPDIDDGQLEMQTSFPISWIEKSPDGDEIYAALYTNAFDHIKAFDVGNPPNNLSTSGPDFDFRAMTSGAGDPMSDCDVDNIYFEPELTAGEIWIACRTEPNLRVVYNDNTSSAYMPIRDAGFTLGARVTPQTPQDNQIDVERRITFERGGSVIASHRLNSFDQALVDRVRDDMSALQFYVVTQMWPLESTNQGETVLIFDRGNADAEDVDAADIVPPRLIPIFRAVGSGQWVLSGNQQQLSMIELPEETFAVIPFGEIRVNNGAAPGYGNILTLEPTTGDMRFWRYDINSPVSPTPVNFFNYEPQSQFRMAPPAPTERLLLTPSISGDYVFFALQNSRRVWRIETRFSSDMATPATIPLRRTFAADIMLPSGLVAGQTDNEFWAVQRERDFIVREYVSLMN